jgi:signal transduction histidine kinase
LTWLTVGGWVAAVLGGVTATWLSLCARRQGVRVARGCHELRGPLGALRLGIDLALRQGRLGPERIAALDLQLRRAAVALADLSGAGAEEPRELVCLPRLAGDVVAALGPLAAQRGVSLEVGEMPETVVLAARVRLAQALTNLVANAIEHGGGRVCVTGRVGEGTARIEVGDDGPGLDRPLAELVRAPARRFGLGVRGGVPAHGHGLAVAAAVAGAYGGRLLSAPSDRGARLVLELPLSVAGAAAGAAATT